MNEPNDKPKTAEDVYSIICQLSPDERQRLEFLMDKSENSGWASPEVKRAWMDEIERREQLHREGKNPEIPWEEAREKVREHLDCLRQ